jgi:hypothetical protein
MQDHVELIILSVLIALTVINDSKMGPDYERAELARIRDSSGYLIRYGPTN